MKTLLIGALLLVTAGAQAQTRELTLEDAIEIAIRVDPLMEEVTVDRERTKVATLRTQLDRITLKIDGNLQELWNKVNIAGPTLGTCKFAGFTIAASASTCASSGGVYVPLSNQSPSAAQGLFNLSAQLNVPLFAGFRIDATVKRAQRTEEAAIVQVRRQRKDTALAAARAFWSVRRAELLRDVNRATLLRMEDAEKIAEGRVKAGLAPQIDRNRAANRRLQQAAAVAEYVGEIEESIAQLGVSLGLTGDVRLRAPFTFPETEPPSPDALVAAARHDRSELTIAKLQLQAQRQAIRIARSGYYPQLGVFGLFQYGNNQLSVGTGARDVSAAANPFSDLSGSLTLGGSLNMNFFNMLNTYTASKDAEYEAARLVSEQRRIERLVDADVLSMRARVMRLYTKRAPLRQSVDVARDNAKILEARYKSGDALVIELLDAQNELGTAEASLVDVEAQLELAWLELRAALGETLGKR